MNRKGFAADTITIVIFIGVFVIAMVLAANIYGKMADNNFFNQTTIDFSQYGNRTFESLNTGIIILLVGLGLGLVVAGFYIQTHPVVFIVYLIIFIFMVMMTGPMSNMYMNILSTDSLIDTANQYEQSLYAVGYLPIIIMVFGIITSIVIFSKIYGGGK